MSKNVTFSFGESLKAVQKEFEDIAKQTNFALSQALNDAVETTRKKLIEETWPGSIRQRNTSFMRTALTTKGGRASKTSLRAAIVESDRINGRGSLETHADGGTKKPKGTAIAVPAKELNARRTAKGVPKSLRPRNMQNAFLQGDVIYQRVGKYKKKSGKDTRRRKLMYVLKTSVSVRKDVPFREVFDQTMQREVRKKFDARFLAAMRNRK